MAGPDIPRIVSEQAVRCGDQSGATDRVDNDCDGEKIMTCRVLGELRPGSRTAMAGGSPSSTPHGGGRLLE